MRGVIDDQRAERLSRAASAQLIVRIRCEKKEAKGGLQRFLAEVEASCLSDYVLKLKHLN